MRHALPFSVLGVALVLAVVAALVTANAVASGDSQAKEAAASRKSHESDRNAVRSDVRDEERYLRAFQKSLGRSALPVRTDEVKPPLGVEENILTGKLIVGDFHDTFVDEGIVLTGVRAEEVKEIANRPTDQLEPKPQAPSRITKPGFRLIKVTLRVTNRSGDATDPACGIDSEFSAYAWDDAGARGGFLSPSYDNVGTYATSCDEGLPDGASGDIVIGVGVPKAHKLKALMFEFLNNKWDPKGGSDGKSQVLVFDDPV